MREVPDASIRRRPSQPVSLSGPARVGALPVLAGKTVLAVWCEVTSESEASPRLIRQGFLRQGVSARGRAGRSPVRLREAPCREGVSAGVGRAAEDEGCVARIHVPGAGRAGSLQHASTARCEGPYESDCQKKSRAVRPA